MKKWKVLSSSERQKIIRYQKRSKKESHVKFNETIYAKSYSWFSTEHKATKSFPTSSGWDPVHSRSLVPSTHTHILSMFSYSSQSLIHYSWVERERCFENELIHPRTQHNDLYMWCYAQQWSFNTRAHPRCLEVGCHLIAVEKLIFPTLHGPRWEAGPSCSKSEYQQINWYPADKC